MTEQEFKNRTQVLALNVIQLATSLPKTDCGRIISRQLIRSITSVGANYRACCRARSPADMLAKLKIVEEEADESLYRLELLVKANIKTGKTIEEIIKETTEILSMTVASIKTLRSKI